MPNINNQIQQIITTRKEARLPQIEKEIKFLQDVKSKVANLDSVINTVNHQMAEKHGPYYAMLQSDPSMESRFMAVSTTQVKKLIDEQLEQKAENWNVARMGKVELTVLRLALYEMQYDEDVPAGVAINEAVELAKKFGQESSGAFVNAVLAKFV